MLCVTIIDRIVRNTSRPIRTGRQTLTNASSPTNARSPTTSVAHGSRCPPPPKRTDRPPQMPGAEVRAAAAELEVRAERGELADRDDLLADDGRAGPEPHAVLERRSAARRRATPRRGRRPRRSARRRRGACDLLVRGERAERVGVRAERLEERGVERPVVSVGVERGGKRDALGREPREHRLGLRRLGRLARARSTSSTSFSVMNPRFSIAERSMPCSSASSTAFRVALRSPAAGFGAGFAVSRRVERSRAPSADSAT